MEWLGLVEGFLIALLVLALPLLMFAARRRWLARQGGMFECSLRLAAAPGSGWALGVARYRSEDLEWFRIFSLAFRPRLRLNRRSTTVVDSRAPDHAEALMLYRDQQVLTLADPQGRRTELAMGCESITGLLSWLEAAPPGQSDPT